MGSHRKHPKQPQPKGSLRYVLRIDSVAGTVTYPLGSAEMVGQYVAHYNPDAYNGRGYATGTDDIQTAVWFDSQSDALRFWQQTSTIRPTRADGQPNRPLTAFTVEVVSIVLRKGATA